MSAGELCEAFGTTLDEVERDVEAFERRSCDSFEFVASVEGKPREKMRATSRKLYDFEPAAIDAAANREGILRSAYIRRA